MSKWSYWLVSLIASVALFSLSVKAEPLHPGVWHGTNQWGYITTFHIDQVAPDGTISARIEATVPFRFQDWRHVGGKRNITSSRGDDGLPQIKGGSGNIFSRIRLCPDDQRYLCYDYFQKYETMQGTFSGWLPGGVRLPPMSTQASQGLIR